jgi:hypothetical protein
MYNGIFCAVPEGYRAQPAAAVCAAKIRKKTGLSRKVGSQESVFIRELSFIFDCQVKT